jgi:hypothetical protein
MGYVSGDSRKSGLLGRWGGFTSGGGGSGGGEDPFPPDIEVLLQEDGFAILLESADYILLE